MGAVLWYSRPRLDGGQAVGSEGVDGGAHRLVVAAELLSNQPRRLPTTAGEQDLAAAYGKAGRRAQPSFESVALLQRDVADKERFSHAGKDTLFPKLLLAIALASVGDQLLNPRLVLAKVVGRVA